MSSLNDELQIDCSSTAAAPRRARPTSQRSKPAAPLSGKQAPVGLRQRPMPPPDEWDAKDVRSAEFGSADELRAQLIDRLEEALARARGDWKASRWDLHSPTWPYTKIGLLLLRCISISDALAERMGTLKKEG